MKYVRKTAYYLGVRDEKPNQDLAALLAKNENAAGIAEIASYLRDRNAALASDCIKVLYEIGYLKPGLIRDYAAEFASLLESKNNRMVWGGMTALSTVAALAPQETWKHVDLILEAVRNGSVITVVSGVRVLAALCAASDEYYGNLLPELARLVRNCRPSDLAGRLETVLPVMRDSDRDALLAIVEKKKTELSPAQLKRTENVIRRLEPSAG